MPSPDCRYVICCVDASDRDITEMTDQSVRVGYQTMMRHCIGLREWAKRMNYSYRKNQGLTLKEDWHVSFCRSKYRGKLCYYVVHSAIEYIWVQLANRKISRDSARKSEAGQEDP